MLLATVVGRVAAAIRGVGTGTSSSRVSLILRAAAGAIRGCPEAGKAGAGRTAMGRGTLLRRTALALASGSASAWTDDAFGRSPTERETLALTL